MPKVRFLAFIKSLTGVSEVEIDGPKTIRDVLNELSKLYPKLADIILDEIPDVNVVLGGRTLLLPNDLDLIFDQELILAPIIEGG